MSDLYGRVVHEAMERLRWTRKKAEHAATKLMKHTKPQVVVQQLQALNVPMESPKPKRLHVPGKQTKAKNVASPKRAPTRAAIAKLPPVNPPRPPPKNARERMERALGPDDGRRRRGGSPTVQGGSPGLGKRS
jgi:hypothetical protein